MELRQRIAIGALVVSLAGAAGIAQWEGFTDRAVIPIPGDVPTIGHGTTVYPDGTPVKLGDTATRKEAVAYFQHDLDAFERGVKRCVKVPLYQYEYDAYMSLTYNIGVTAFCGSTLVRKLNSGDYSGACAQISRWNRAQGREVKGLTNRREQERKTCENR